MANINLYMDNPTAGGTDGSEVSQGTGLNPVSVTLDATKEESKIVKCALRCNEGYKTDGDVVIIPIGDKASYWTIGTDGETFSDDLTITDEIGAANYVVYLKARSDDTDASKDNSVYLRVTAKIISA